MKSYLNYKSNDNYFNITEILKQNYILVIYTYTSIIYGMKNFKTFYYYDINGDLIRYKNSLGTDILYKIPIQVINKPRLISF